MWFEDQQGRMVNSDHLEMMSIMFVNEKEWSVVVYQSSYESVLYTLYTGDKEKCRNWLKKLVTTINQFKQGIG